MADVIDLTSLPASASVDVAGAHRVSPFANFLLAALAEHAPAEIRAELEHGEVTHWHLTNLQTRETRVLATTPLRYFRSILGAMGARHLPHALYGGYRCCQLHWQMRVVPAVLYLGNDSLHGLWFRGRSGPPAN